MIRLNSMLAIGMAASVTVLVSCGGQADRQSAGEEAVAPAPAPAPDLSTDRGLTGVAKSGNTMAPTTVPAPPPSPSRPAPVQDGPTAMIIRTGTARIEVDSLDRAVAAVRGLAARVGGYVANVSMETGRHQVRQATLELRLPADRFDDALSGLEPLGEVESVDVSAQDVGEEFVDLTARVANARRLEERLIRLLETRTGRLEDVLAVERELARVREEIERLEGRLRYLRTRVAISTLTVTTHEAAPIVSQPGENILGRALIQAWRNFVEFLAATIAALGFIVPLTLLGGALGWIGRRTFRRVRRVAA